MFRDPEGKLSVVRVLLMAWAGAALVLWVAACCLDLRDSEHPKLVAVPDGVVPVLTALAAVRGVQAVGERFGARYK